MLVRKSKLGMIAGVLAVSSGVASASTLILGTAMRTERDIAISPRLSPERNEIAII
jgi:hypothetical protein